MVTPFYHYSIVPEVDPGSTSGYRLGGSGYDLHSHHAEGRVVIVNAAQSGVGRQAYEAGKGRRHVVFVSSHGLLRTGFEIDDFGSDLVQNIGHPSSPSTGVRWERQPPSPLPLLKDFLKIVLEQSHEHRPAQTKRATGKALENLEEAISFIVAKQFANLAILDVGLPSPQEPNPTPGYDAAVDAGAQARTRIFKSPDMLSSEQLADRLGVSRETVNQWRRERQLLGLSNGTRSLRYPEWQAEPPIRASLPSILHALSQFEAWNIYLFLTQGNPLLQGASPLEKLRLGEIDAVLRTAQLHAAEAA